MRSTDKVDTFTPKIVRSYRWAILRNPWHGYMGVWLAIVWSFMLGAILGHVSWMILLQAGIYYTVWLGARRDFMGLRNYGNKQWAMGIFAALAILNIGWAATGFIFHNHPALIMDNALRAVQTLTIFAVLRLADHDDGELEQTLKDKLHKPSLRLATEQT